MIQSVWKTGFNQFCWINSEKKAFEIEIKNDHKMQYEFRKMFKLWFFVNNFTNIFRLIVRYSKREESIIKYYYQLRNERI